MASTTATKADLVSKSSCAESASQPEYRGARWMVILRRLSLRSAFVCQFLIAYLCV